MKNARVLVIDDEPSVVDAIKTILTDSGYEAVTAVTIREALAHSKTLGFDLAIVDLRLPDADGIVALESLLRRFGDVTAILITAHDRPGLTSDAIGAGFVYVLVKPFSPSTLLDAVQTALSRRRLKPAGRPHRD